MKGQSPAPTSRFAVIGAHGGAGVSTVAHFLDPAGQGYAVELPPGSSLPQYYIPVVVARSTAYGLLRTGELLSRWHPGIPRPWLVIVRDSPVPLPPPVKYRTRALSSRTLGIAHVPYLYRLRLADNPAEALTHRPVAKAARDLRARLGLD